MKYLITGGAGFIGSNLADKLLESGNEVVVFDNFKTGHEVFVRHNLNKPNYHLIRGDCLDLEALSQALEGVETVFHFQANADVRGGMINNRLDLEQNVIASYNVFEACRINGVKKIAFSSSATVYGEPSVFPTPETNPLIQTSVYGASKLANEAYLQAFSEYYDIHSFVFRFVSFIGDRYTHGVIFDFLKKLLANPEQLEILGDGKQRKSYLHVSDGVEAMLKVVTTQKEKKNVYNLGHGEICNVVDLANIILDEIKLKNVKFVFTGGERGWKGDSPFVHLDTTKIKALGWKPKISIEEGIRSTVRYLMENKQLFSR